MTIYWERCSVCGYHSPVKQCTLFPDLMVDAKCCLLCPKRGVCPKPAWRFEGLVERGVVSPDERRKLLVELLERLEEKQGVPGRRPSRP
ncbi:hypothetical protein Desmu_1187 [Desulfurococcus mucosus DSM 2162]|uniref:Uncharacterized protein n=1 Tax=Desulfurococcus mucosus (strain ATCC 35584 / DSM 2162 / JCM 9187 / O7/1) TaxID=765177 RepID=E8RAP8_DESM0|nr:hypothetical protein Desmu_1187 [Desulfurococcus mucosus DSM 2162]